MIFQSFNLATRASVISNVMNAFVPDIPLARLIGYYKKEEELER